MVIALGGGAFVATRPTRTCCRERGVTIWLDCPFPRVCANAWRVSPHRPLARDPEKFEQLYQDRRAAYAKAEYRIEVDTDDPAEIVAAIFKLPIF